MAVSYTEKAGSPREYLYRGLAEVERKLICNWAERITLARELLGYYRNHYYYPPDQYRPAGNETLYNIYAYECQIEPIGTYEKALVTVRYKFQDQYLVGENPVFITERIEPAAEFLTLTKTGLYFGTGGSKVPLGDDIEAPAKIIRMFDWVYTLRGIFELTAPYYDLPGKVNDAEVYSRALNRFFPAETLLCGNPSAERDITRDGAFTWTVTYRFTYRNQGTLASPKGWNHWPRTDNADVTGIKFEKITDGTDNVPIYTLADFTAVIR